MLPLKGKAPDGKSVKSIVIQGMNQPSCVAGDGLVELDFNSTQHGKYVLLLDFEQTPFNSNRWFSEKLWKLDGDDWIRDATQQTSWNHYVIYIRLLIAGDKNEPAGSFVSQLLRNQFTSFALAGKCVHKPGDMSSSVFDRAELILVLDRKSEETLSFTLKAEPLAVTGDLEVLKFVNHSPPLYGTVPLAHLTSHIFPDQNR
jgi:hypothetical protein